MEIGVTAIFLIAIVFSLCVTTNSQDVRVFYKLGAVAKKCGNVAVDKGATHLSMVLRLVIYEKELSLPSLNEEYMKELNESWAYVYNLSWLLQYAPTSEEEPQSSPFNILVSHPVRKQRSPLLGAFGFAFGGAVIFN